MIRVFGDALGDEPASSAGIDPEAMEQFAPTRVRATQPYKEDHFEIANVPLEALVFPRQQREVARRCLRRERKSGHVGAEPGQPRSQPRPLEASVAGEKDSLALPKLRVHARHGFQPLSHIVCNRILLCRTLDRFR